VSIFVARQPIFERGLSTVGYELLFRSGWENVFSHNNPDEASGHVIHNSMMEFGFKTLIGSNLAYINITREVLLKEMYTIFPSSGVVLELVENVKPDPEVFAACKKLKQLGYQLALDDFVYDSSYNELLAISDIVKIDFISTDRGECESLVARLAKFDVDLVAEKVETRADYLQAITMGYKYFQGFFFSKPEIVTREEVPKFKLNYLQFLKEVNQPNINYEELGGIIKRELSLSIKLLRFLNSAALGLTLEITSIRHALALLGEQKIKKWASTVALTHLGQDKPAELAVTGLVRAQFCETAGGHAGLAELDGDLFLAGLLSVVDGLTGRPIDELVAELSLPHQTREALLGRNNSVFKALSLVRAIEHGDWARVSRLTESFGVPEYKIQESYNLAVSWADNVFQPVAAEEIPVA